MAIAVLSVFIELLVVEHYDGYHSIAMEDLFLLVIATLVLLLSLEKSNGREADVPIRPRRRHIVHQ